MMKENMETVKQFLRVNHANAHGIRKGSASYVTNGSTCVPSVSSVCIRGDWSMGQVLDVYWQFGDAGDNYLGRVLCGLDPNKNGFATMPPHFNVEGNLMEDEDIEEAMQIMYGPILDSHRTNDEIDPTGILLLVLASVVYHSDWLNCIITSNPGHHFCLIPLINCPEVISRLKAKVR